MNEYLSTLLNINNNATSDVQKKISEIRTSFTENFQRKLLIVEKMLSEEKPNLAIYPQIVNQYRELCGIVNILNMYKERSSQDVKYRIMADPPGGKAPAATLLESMADTSDEVLLWQKNIVMMTVLRDQYAGLIKTIDLSFKHGNND